MFDYLRYKLTQKSTWFGIGVVLAAVMNGGMSPDAWVEVLAGFGLVATND